MASFNRLETSSCTASLKALELTAEPWVDFSFSCRASSVRMSVHDGLVKIFFDPDLCQNLVTEAGQEGGSGVVLSDLADEKR